MKIKRDKATRVDPEKMLSEKVADGLTLGPESREEADERFPNLPGAPDLGYLSRPGGVKFRALTPKDHDLLLCFPDGRTFAEPEIAFTAEDKQRIEHGYLCLRCMEPQSGANADDHIDGCIGVAIHGERYMRDGFHLIDVAAEFDEQEVHVGPARPLRAYLESLDEKQARREFAAKKGR